MSTVTTKEQTRKNVAKALASLMDEHGKSQAEIVHGIRGAGESVTAVRQRVYRYVHGLTDTVGDDLANMAEFFDVSADFILGGGRRKKSRRAG